MSAACPYVAERPDRVTYQCTRPLGHDGDHACHALGVPPRAFHLYVTSRAETDADSHAEDVWHTRHDGEGDWHG